MTLPVFSANYDTPNQMHHDGGWDLAGPVNIDRVNGGTCYFDGVPITATGGELNADTGTPGSATLTPAAGIANTCLVSIQVLDNNGVALTYPEQITWWLSDAATGAGLTATTASGAVGAGASGVDFGVLTAKKATISQTTAAGLYVLSILDTANTHFYVCVQLASGKIFVSPQLTTLNY